MLPVVALRRVSRELRRAVLRREEILSLLHARRALGGVGLAVPEAHADPLVRLLHILLLVHALRVRWKRAPGHLVRARREGDVPEIVVVLNADQVVQHNLARLLVAVGAIRSSSGFVTVAPGHPLYALVGLGLVDIQPNLVWVDLLVGHAHGRARAGQGEPQRCSTEVLALLTVPVCLRLGQVLCYLGLADLATDDEAVLLVHFGADGR
mmetsp:Transcript_30363/g.69053  ORF Transcript_30363/g.69053 Transcript_30363/m.69053 type:complete len:209 (+) Transcript_30363:217-843(+)